MAATIEEPIEFVELEPQKLVVAGRAEFAVQSLELAFAGRVMLRAFGNAPDHLRLDVAIQPGALSRRFHQPLMFVLAVDLDEHAADLA